MTENELFEQWFNKQLDSGYAVTSDEQITRWAWNAAIAKQSAEIAQYKAQGNELRKALSEIHECLMARGGGDEYLLNIVDKALAKTAPQCLQEHDNEVIERCAKACEEIITEDDAEFYTYAFAETIRALKGKQNAI